MKPTQQRTEEGEDFPNYVWVGFDEDDGGPAAVSPIAPPENHYPRHDWQLYFPADFHSSRVTALELELERAKDLLAGMADTKRQDDHAFWNLEAELERSKEEVKRLRDALEKIANIDHRGNRHHSQWIAFEALSVPPKVRDLGEGQ